jgi:hypothetical protein
MGMYIYMEVFVQLDDAPEKLHGFFHRVVVDAEAVG